MKLATRILWALALGAVTGILINIFANEWFDPIDGYLFTPLGTIFLNLIKMLIVPLVFFSIAVGVANIGDPKKLGRMGGKTMAFFFSTTAIAITIGIVFALVLKPGVGGSFDTSNLEYEATEAPPVSETLLGIIPANPIEAMASGDMLAIIFFALFIGIGVAALDEKVDTVKRFLEQGNELMMFLVGLVMKFAPIGTFGLIASAVGKQGFDALKAMFFFMVVVFLAMAVHLIFVYGGAMKLLAKQSPVKVMKEFIPAMMVAFSTSSSSATLPIAMNIAQTKLGVPKPISSFVPVSYTHLTLPTKSLV